jgi:hypothetical protein
MRLSHTAVTAATRCVGVIAVAVVVACGGSAGFGATGGSGSNSPSPAGHLHIVATVGPTCPVQKAGGPVCTAPYAGPLEVIRPDGSVLQVTTSAAGFADIDLPPGAYQITLTASSGGMNSLHQPVRVTIVAGASATATANVDTGIR